MRMLMRSLITALFLNFLSVYPLRADPLPLLSDSHEQIILGSIQFVGLVRTSDEFVLGELGFEARSKVSKTEVEAAVQRLRNTNFFISVDLEFNPGADNRTNLKLIFREKWTLTPVLRGGTGGGVNFFVVGIYDLNLLGRGVEAGIQYEQFAGAPGVNLWWRQPYFSRPAWRLMIEAQAGRRPAFFLNSQTLEYSIPLARNQRVLLAVQRRFSSFELGLGIEPLDRALDELPLAPVAGFVNFSRQRETGVNTKFFVRMNSLNLNDYLWDGFRIELNGSQFFSTRLPKDGDFQSLSMMGTHFWRLMDEHNIGFRFQAQWTSGSSLLSLIRLGSLDSVRGLDDGERIGQLSCSVNVEERWVAYVNESLVLQTVLFSDAGNAGKSLADWPLPVAASAGGGLRIGFRPIARLRLRADYARALSGLRKSQTWVVGMQHYF